MKFGKVGKEDYSKIIGQIDSLKSNLTQLIHVNQDLTRTTRIANPSKQKSPIASRLKTSRNTTSENKTIKKNASRANKQNSIEGRDPPIPSKLWEKLIEVEKSNQEMKSNHLILEEMLRIEREKRIKLETQLREITKEKNTVGIQKNIQPSRDSFKIFTPQRTAKNQGPKRKQSKTRDEGDIQSFLLGDCDDYVYSSPKKRNQAQIQIMQLLQQVSRPGPLDRRDQMKSRLLEAVKRFIRK